MTLIVPSPCSASRRLCGRRCVLRITLAVATAVYLASAPGAHADVQFSLDNIVFADGSSATGTFSFDETNGDVSQWSVSYTGVPGDVPSDVFNPASSNAAYNPSFDDLALMDLSTTEELFLAFAGPLDAHRDPVLLLNSDGFETEIVSAADFGVTEYIRTPLPFVLSPSPFVDPVPEPSTLPLFCGMLGILLLIRRAARRPISAPIQSARGRAAFKLFLR